METTTPAARTMVSVAGQRAGMLEPKDQEPTCSSASSTPRDTSVRSRGVASRWVHPSSCVSSKFSGNESSGKKLRAPRDART